MWMVSTIMWPMGVYLILAQRPSGYSIAKTLSNLVIRVRGILKMILMKFSKERIQMSNYALANYSSLTLFVDKWTIGSRKNIKIEMRVASKAVICKSGIYSALFSYCYLRVWRATCLCNCSLESNEYLNAKSNWLRYWFLVILTAYMRMDTGSPFGKNLTLVIQQALGLITFENKYVWTEKLSSNALDIK